MENQLNAPSPTVVLEYATEPHPDPFVAELTREIEALLRGVESRRQQIAERLKHGPDPG